MWLLVGMDSPQTGWFWDKPSIFIQEWTNTPKLESGLGVFGDFWGWSKGTGLKS